MTSELKPVPTAYTCLNMDVRSQVSLRKDGTNSNSYLQVGIHAVTYTCRTALQAYVIDVIHSLVEEQISPVLVRLATTGPQVRAPSIDYLLSVTTCMGTIK